MKKNIFQLFFLVVVFSVVLFSCQKEKIEEPTPMEEMVTSANNQHGHLKQTKTYSSEVVQKWIDMKYRILRTAQEPQLPNGFFIPGFYSALGISLYESVVPGMPAYQPLYGQLNQMPEMPSTNPGMAYHWAANANAALAQTFRNFLPNTTIQNKTAIDSLENALNIVYINETDAPTFQRSKDFGKDVANRVFDWYLTDGSRVMYPSYVLPVGPGLWTLTPPGFATPVAVNLGKFRPLMPGVLQANEPPPPTTYSTLPGSDFYNNMVEVYNTTQQLILNPALKAQANYWRGTPGGGGFILWFAILRKVLAEQDATLDKAALVYCKMGISLQDATIALFKARYFYNELAPITYIRNTLGFTTWNTEFPTPPSPCYPEFHSMLNSASAGILIQEFGHNYQLNTDGIHPTGQPGYIFNSFTEAEEHSNQSRFLAGVGTKYAVTGGSWIGNKTAEYLSNEIHFLK